MIDKLKMKQIPNEIQVPLLRHQISLGTAIEMMTTHQCSTNGHHTILHRPHQLQRQPGEQIQRQLHQIQQPADHLLYLQEQRLHIPLEIRFLRFSIKYLAANLVLHHRRNPHEINSHLAFRQVHRILTQASQMHSLKLLLVRKRLMENLLIAKVQFLP